MTASSGPSGPSDTAWPEPGQWDPPHPEAVLLPPLQQPRTGELDESSLFHPEPFDPVPMAEPPAEPVDPPEPAAKPTVPAEPLGSVADDPPRPPKRRRSRIGIALVDAIGILLIIVAIALVGKAIADRRNANTNETPTSVTPASVDANAPPPTQPGRSISGITPCPKTDGTEARVTSFQKAPPRCIDITKRYRATILTNKGALNLTLDAVNAPMAVNNFVVLARYHYFDNTICPRIIPGYLFQCGDPSGKGTGGPGYAFPDELPGPAQYQIGSVAMATSSPDTNGSQFFVVLGSDGVALPPKYSLFAQVDPNQGAVLTAVSAAGTEQGTPTKEMVTIESVVIVEG